MGQSRCLQSLICCIPRPLPRKCRGLSWVYPSEKTLNSSTHVATARLTVPKTGQYLIRVRHAVNGGSALADVNVNGAYYYEDMPISLSYKACAIPADGNSYATMTCCNNFGTDDPYLFIHGGGRDKIVGFNDDGPAKKNPAIQPVVIGFLYLPEISHEDKRHQRKQFQLFQAQVELRHNRPCSGGHAAQSVARLRAKGADAAGVHALPAVDESVKIEAPANIGGSISITADENIQKVSAYGLAGELIGSAGCEGFPRRDAGVITQYKPSGRLCHKRPDREWSRIRENSCQLKTKHGGMADIPCLHAINES